MIKTYFVDTETCGLTGPPVLLQYAIDEGPVNLVDVFLTKVKELKRLIREFMDNRLVCHNLAFDHHVLSKLHNMITNLHDDERLENLSLTDLVELEWRSQYGPCLKPRQAVDTMALSSKGDQQSAVMAMKPVVVRRIPREYGELLADELNRRTELPWILFGRSKERKATWKVSERETREGDPDYYFVDVKLSFSPSNGLKELTEFHLDRKPPHFEDVEPDEWPVGEGFAPFAKLLFNGVDWKYTTLKGDTGFLWPALIHDHIKHWRDNQPAREYGTWDIVNLRDLYKFFGAPEHDDDSLLAAQIASVRLRGFPFDKDAMRKEMKRSEGIVAGAEVNVDSPKQVKAYIAEALDPMERIIVDKSANAQILDKIQEEFNLEEEEECECEDPRFCVRCEGKGVVGPGPMLVARRAAHIEEVRKHRKRVNVYNKLLKAGRAYVSMRAIGTKSGRLSGTDGLNFQGIESSEEVRSLFTLADDGWVLSGGDFDSQELAIAATTMNDPDLLADLRKGKSLHGIFGSHLFEVPYGEVMKKEESTDYYGRAKTCVYLTLYGGTFQTMAEKAQVEEEVAEKAFNSFFSSYPAAGHNKKVIADQFTSIRQSEDRKIELEQPKCKYVESIFGYRRHFDTEYYLQEVIFNLAQDLPQEWKEDERRIVRDTKNERSQTMAGAISSALYGAAFSIQNGVIRAANNHKIQSAGRSITIGLQQDLWGMQPVGIHDFRILLMSVHDEIAASTPPENVEEATEVVRQNLEKQCERVPLLAMGWARHLKHWYHMKKAKPENSDMVLVGFQL